MAEQNIVNNNVDPGNFSLLWPRGKFRSIKKLESKVDEHTVRDIELDKVVEGFTANQRDQADIKRILTHMTADLDVIAYRQDVIEDFLTYPQIAKKLAELLPNINMFGEHHYKDLTGGNSIYEVTWRLGELESYVECVEGLYEIFETVDTTLNSTGLSYLKDFVYRVKSDEVFEHLSKELPELLSRIRNVQSVTIGVNLDAKLQPCQATLVAVNNKKFTSQSILDKLFGRHRNQAFDIAFKNFSSKNLDKVFGLTTEKMEGISTMHSVPHKKIEMGQHATLMDPDVFGYQIEPKMVPLFRDLAQVLETSSRPLAKKLQKYISLESNFFINLKHELVFYLGAINLLDNTIKSGMRMCRPEILPMSERIYTIEEGYNINLVRAFQKQGKPGEQVDKQVDEQIVTNEYRFDDAGRIIILTGPNRGGKTTYIQSIALTQILAQAGVFVPGTSAQISPVDSIYTHFPVEEKIDRGTGRLGDEAKRFNYIFSHATGESLIILNESLSSTNAGESLYIAEDLLLVLKKMGTRAIFATHLHELAANVDSLNENPGESRIISMVSRVAEGTDRESVKRTYKVIEGPPMGHSYALQIAKNYGISYDQLTELLEKREVLGQS